MSKTASSVVFEMKTKQKMPTTSAIMSKNKNDMKVKLRQEISQAFH